jgi:hypothetical protein
LNRNEDAFEITEHIVVPEPKHSITFLVQAAISYSVGGRFAVLSTIHFDDQKLVPACEITDVAVYRLLPHEFVSVDLPVTNAIPENCFRIGLIGP